MENVVFSITNKLFVSELNETIKTKIKSLWDFLNFAVRIIYRNRNICIFKFIMQYCYYNHNCGDYHIGINTGKLTGTETETVTVTGSVTWIDRKGTVIGAGIIILTVTVTVPGTESRIVTGPG